MNQLLNTVLGMFPRWLLVTAGAVVLTFFAASAYYGMQMLAADTELHRAQAGAATINPYDPKFGNFTTLRCRDGIDGRSEGGSGYPVGQVPKNAPNPPPPGYQYPCP